MQSPPNAVTRADSTSKNVDVFEFLDQDQIDPSHTVTPLRQRRCDPARRLSAHDHEESDKESVTRSIFSDSGISLNDSTTTASSQPFTKTRLETLPEYNNAQPMEEGPNKSGGHPFDPYLAGWPGYRAHHFGDGFPQYRTRTNPEHNARERGDSGSVSPNDRRALLDAPTAVIASDHPTAVIASGHPTASGYNLLASKLSQPTEHEEALPPVYRKFTKLNHRILLQLQDEIAEMEEDLERLDHEDSQLRHQPNGVNLPDSRRMSWSWLGSELQARRLDLLGKIYIKIEQYNQAITMIQKVTRATSVPKDTEIQKYRDWLGRRRPLAKAEGKFLDNHLDVLSLQIHDRSVESDFLQRDDCSNTCIVILLLTFLPLIAFKATSDIVCRLIVVGFTFCVGILWNNQHGETGLLAHRHGWFAQIALLGFVALIF